MSTMRHPGLLGMRTASSGLGPWRLSHDPTICQALPNAFFDALGLPRLADGS